MVLFMILLCSLARTALFGLSKHQLRLRAVLRMAKERAGVFSDIVGSLNTGQLGPGSMLWGIKKKTKTLLA